MTVAALGLAVTAFAGFTAPVSAEPLNGAAIESVLSGVTIHGVYEDGSRFSEMYTTSGALSYFDADVFSAGQWSVEGDLFCTTYDSAQMSSGCFAVERESANCLLFFSAADGAPFPPPSAPGKGGGKAPDAAPAVEEAYLVARGWDESVPTTCEGVVDLPEQVFAAPAPATPGPAPDAVNPTPGKTPPETPSPAPRK